MLQIVGGHRTQALQFKKPGSCFLSWYWQALQTAMSRGWAWSNAEVRRELLSCIVLLPLTNFDLRNGASDVLVATDVSEFGWGACATTGLTGHGMLMGVKLLKMEDHPIGLGVALIDLDNGIGGARQALHLLGCNVQAFAACSTRPEGTRVVKSHWPEVLELPGLNNITAKWIEKVEVMCTNVQLVIVCSGLNKGGDLSRCNSSQ